VSGVESVAKDIIEILKTAMEDHCDDLITALLQNDLMSYLMEAFLQSSRVDDGLFGILIALVQRSSQEFDLPARSVVKCAHSSFSKAFSWSH